MLHVSKIRLVKLNKIKPSAAGTQFKNPLAAVESQKVKNHDLIVLKC